MSLISLRIHVCAFQILSCMCSILRLGSVSLFTWDSILYNLHYSIDLMHSKSDWGTCICNVIDIFYVYIPVHSKYSVVCVAFYDLVVFLDSHGIQFYITRIIQYIYLKHSKRDRRTCSCVRESLLWVYNEYLCSILYERDSILHVWLRNTSFEKNTTWYNCTPS